MGASGKEQHVDHANGDKLDNRRANLRVGTRRRNMQNQRPHRDNKTGFLGVSPVKHRPGLHRGVIVASGAVLWSEYGRDPQELRAKRLAQKRAWGLPTEAEEAAYRITQGSTMPQELRESPSGPDLGAARPTPHIES